MTRLSLLLPALLLGTACGGAEHEPPPASSGGQAALAGTAGQAPTASLGGGGAADEGVAGNGAAGESASGAPAVEIVDVADVPCAVSSAVYRVFMEPEPLELSFNRAGLVGDRRFAFDSASLAFLTFDADGANASDIVYADVAAVTALGEQLVTLELGEQGELTAKSYDALAQPLSGSLELDDSSGTSSHALAASPDGVMAVWRNQTELRARLITPERALADGIDFGPLSCGQHACSSTALWTGERFVVFWSRGDATSSVLSWAAIDENGALLSARNVFSSPDEYRVVGATPLAAGRVAVLMTLGSPAQAPVLLFVDAFGTPEPTLRRFLGATEAWGIASYADGLALVARSNDAQAVLRPLSMAGEAVTDWACLDDSGKRTAFEPRAALFAAADGYEAVVRLTDGSAAQQVLDGAGQARE